MRRVISGFLISISVLAAAGCASTGPFAGDRTPSDADLLASLPAPIREFRGVWVATVANIDWPPEPGLPVEKQKASMRSLLDRAQSLNLNAVILQVRPMSDALYNSPFEPWSYYLTGEQGKAPDPYYDPLEFAVDEAHRRGMELHAWFNPFRAWHITTGDSLSALHVRERRPESVVQYGEQTWMDPGSPQAVEHALAVIMDVVDRYDIDGVHLDDYFYPYPVQDSTGAEVPFPDTTSWRAFSRPTDEGNDSDVNLVYLGSDSLRARTSEIDSLRADWRRSNVDAFIHRLYLGVKARKPWVKVGLSPFGIWRPGVPDGVEGFDAYAKLYADARRWIRLGWADYFSPQLYWALDSEGQPYGRLLDWWIRQNDRNRHMWPGLFTSRVILDGSAHWDPPEIVRQIRHTRTVPGATGNVHFSMRAMMPAAHRMGGSVRTLVYDTPALVPPSPWLAETRPGTPAAVIERTTQGNVLVLDPAADRSVRVWVISEYDEGDWTMTLLPGTEATIMLRENTSAAVVRAVDRLGLVSAPFVARLSR